MAHHQLSRVFRSILLVAAGIVAHQGVRALTVQWVEKQPYEMSLSGRIEAGDAERVVFALLNRPTGSIATGVPHLFELNSGGGHVHEAAKIAQLVDLFFADVKVMPGGACASACFLIFLAGGQRWASASDLQPSSRAFGLVGLHRPILPGRTQSSAELHRLTTEQRHLMSAMRGYLADRSVPQYLIDIMMERPSNEIYWLAREDLRRLGTYKPSIEELLIARCGYARELDERRELAAEQGDWSQFRELDARLYAVETCWGESVSTPYRAEQGSKLLSRLRTGWRPWNEPSSRSK